MPAGQYISQVLLKKPLEDASYLARLPVVQYLMEQRSLPLTHAVTFLVGENGTGKSTLMEAIAVAYGFNGEGGSKNFTFSTNQTHSDLWKYLTLVKKGHPKDGFFLRAESFYNVATNIEELDAEPGPGAPISASYGGNLHQRSHGESFFALLNNRLGGGGLYFFDEPEAALSPLRQLSMLRRLKELTDSGSQCVIATHSPILMAFPGSTIYAFSPEGLRRQEYEETDQFRITRDFLNRYPLMLEQLFSDQ